MGEVRPSTPRLSNRGEREGTPSRPSGPRWSPATWIALLVWRWRLYGPVRGPERRGYWFWGPTTAFVLLIELLAALSSSFKNAIPWPTISSTVGHLEKRWDWVAVIVVGLLTVVTFHAIAYRAQRRDDGRAYRRVGRDPADAPEPDPLSWYNWLLVAGVGTVAIVLAIVFDASKYQLGYVIYGVLAFFGIVLPSILSFFFNKVVGFPTLFFTIAKLRHRLHSVAVILVAGLTILAVHLAFYPWPDIAHESASFAGLTADRARAKAERELRKLRSTKPPLSYSTQARSVIDGQDAWSVYFRPATGVPASCVVIVTKSTASFSADCS